MVLILIKVAIFSKKVSPARNYIAASKGVLNHPKLRSYEKIEPGRVAKNLAINVFLLISKPQ